MDWLHPDDFTCWPATALNAHCRGSFKTPAALERSLLCAWDSLCAAEPALFDGAILHVERVDLDRGLLYCRRARYQHIAVRLAGIETGVRALGVSGMIVSEGRVLLARRTDSVHLYPGLWELAPSGTAKPPRADSDRESVDLVGCLLEELSEETGLACEPSHARPFLLAYDAVTKSYDACYVLSPIRMDAPLSTASDEYSQIAWRTIEEALSLGSELIPVSWMMLEAHRPVLW